jgi:hypothetical protein
MAAALLRNISDLGQGIIAKFFRELPAEGPRQQLDGMALEGRRAQAGSEIVPRAAGQRQHGEYGGNAREFA